MKPHVIVLGNEKGGTGKSTLAMHVSVYLLNKGFNICTIDVDARQGTLTQYFKNRSRAAEKFEKLKIKLPKHFSVYKSDLAYKDDAIEWERKAFNSAIKEGMQCDFIIIDTPGNDTFLSQISHSYANTLITPINESFIDLDVLIKVANEDLSEFHPSIYSEMVWRYRRERAIKRKKPLDWIVIKNRLATLYTKNRGDINTVLESLSKRIGFRLGAGFCERVIFRELFTSGLTLLDSGTPESQMTLSHVAARQELRELIKFMNIPVLENNKNMEK